MALIKCQECGKEISSKAQACPNCGCPVEASSEKMMYTIKGKEYDVSFIAQMLSNNQYIQPIIKLRDMAGITNQEATKIVDYYLDNKALPPITEDTNIIFTTPNLPKCPTCGSTNIEKIRVMGRAIDGWFFGRHSVEGRAQFLCKTCGYRW